MRKIRRAASVAYTDGCLLAVCAAATLGFGFNELSSVLVAVFLGAIAAVELWGAQSLRKLDVNAPKRLGINQLALAAAITLWALWGTYSELSHHATASEISQYAPELDANFGQMATQISVIVYLGIIAATILFQGGMALYYFTRRRVLAEYVEQTPPWIIEMQKNGVAL